MRFTRPFRKILEEKREREKLFERVAAELKASVREHQEQLRQLKELNRRAE